MSIKLIDQFEGVLLIENEELFQSSKNLFWKYYEGHCFVLICNRDENQLMANNFLNILLSILKQEIIDAPETLTLILDELMPGGQLMYLTKRSAQEIVNKNFT